MLIGRGGLVETLSYNNFQLTEDAIIQSLKILINQCWKTLPIFEGRDKNNEIIYNREDAYKNFQKHLCFLLTKTSGASKIWQDNQYYIELVYMLAGMQDFKEDEHDRVKYVVHHCTKLINNMIEMVSKNGSEIL